MNDTINSDVEAIGRIDAIPAILDVACRVTGLRFAAVARVTESRWICCAVRDDIALGLVPGGELEIATTICDEIRAGGQAVIIDHVAEDVAWSGHHTPKLYGFQSYISMPIILRDGSFFGTLCALDPEPATLSTPDIISTFKLFAELIALHLESQSRLALSEAALLDAQETAELREQFIAVLGHDLRNPVAAIEAGAAMLAKAPPDEKSARIIAMVEDSCKRMTGLIGDVLDFARGRLGSGLTLVRQIDGGLRAALDQVVVETRAAYPGRQIARRFDLQEQVDCDTQRIAQLLANLLTNALTHGDKDSVVRASAESRGGIFTLSVVNHGQPIPSDKRARLFQPFTRMDEGRPQGLGLGLYIVSAIAKAHGGTVDVTSTAAETVFTLTMPNRG
ncbi:GAF domain-containing sensor histidine kinase [Sphingobium boeckii]|uniref:histidine kinase n=1 Tax=Sphingobium boeckii TaxID=1082345 RepID=A0A7W9AJ01_9SPHN|nr:GAF domain-containing sensor histidine kinase [Sphingobium boeckii]MBB5686520.1 hypothetical protein [Sphingobium boeckii]